MWTPSDRLVGSLTALGGVCALVASVPTRWYGARPTDSYVFDPPRFSALWMERTVVPVVGVIAAMLILVGLLALLWRDREWMARWQRWFAALSVIGAAVGTLATILLVSLGGGGASDPTAAVNALLGVGLALLALLLLGPGLLAWGIGYLRAGRRRLGWALAGGPIAAVLVVAVDAAVGAGFDPLGSLPVVLPLTVAVLVVGYDLYARADGAVA
jgi:hypothetical protein